jgi:Cu(I)/Ag(I) efflux system membrane protein CusA/SilA
MDRYTFRPKALSWIANQVAVGTYYPEEKHPISRALFAVYEPLCRMVLRFPWSTVLIAFLAFAATIPFYFSLGTEFMPPLNEETLLYMPTTLPGISVTEAGRLLQEEDRILRTFPEVVSVLGKAGRAETSTDPAPLSMMETTIVLKPPSQWRPAKTWYSSWAPEWLRTLILRRIWSDHISFEALVNEMDAALKFPGNTNAWVMPIKNRIDMLATGIRTPVGIKIFGPDLKQIEKTGIAIEGILRRVSGTRSVYAERVTGGYFLDFELRRDQLARYGLSVADAEMAVTAAIGGEEITTTVEGRERYTVSLRYPREYREDPDRLGRVLVPTPSGSQIPLSQIATIRYTQGPSMYRDENGMLAGYVFVDITRSDLGGYVKDAKAAVAASLDLPAGYALQWSGQYENILHVRERLKLVVPMTLVLIFGLLYANTRSAFKAALVMAAVPFSAIGAIWLMYALGYHVSIAAWVGMIALMGLDAETGVFMLLFLDLSWEQARREGALQNPAEMKEAIVHGAVKRIRPKMMTVSAAFMGLMPIMVFTGTGADMMKRIAAPMVGGLATSFLLELLVYPAAYWLWRRASTGGPGLHS